MLIFSPEPTDLSIREESKVIDLEMIATKKDIRKVKISNVPLPIYKVVELTAS